MKTELKREITKKELRNRVEVTRRMLTPAFVGLQITRAILDKKSSASNKLVGIFSTIIGGIEASKYGAELFKRIVN
jgi:hypothetical protein